MVAVAVVTWCVCVADIVDVIGDEVWSECDVSDTV